MSTPPDKPRSHLQLLEIFEEIREARQQRDEAVAELECCRRTVGQLKHEIAELEERRRLLERQLEQIQQAHA